MLTWCMAQESLSYYKPTVHSATYTKANIVGLEPSLASQATPSFSMLHAEKWEGPVREITCVTS